MPTFTDVLHPCTRQRAFMPHSLHQVAEARGNARLPSVMALGFIAAFSETLALAVIAEKGLVRSPQWRECL